MNRLFSLMMPAVLALLSLNCSGPVQEPDDKDLWPEVTNTMKPWTRWWWMGSAVDRENLTKRMEEFSEAGIGGVEITPIYGVKGYEDRFLDHLSPEWMDMLAHTLDEAERLGLGVDLVQGTGWPFGGPQVEKEYAAGRLLLQTYDVRAGEPFARRIQVDNPRRREMATLQYVYAFDSNGGKTDLTGGLSGNRLEWTPGSDQTIIAVFTGKTNQQVKRSAPGGEGFVLDHFSAKALDDYLEPYEKVLVHPAKDRLRAFFNDSYEVYNADYTPGFFQEFMERRGYDLSDHLPVLVSEPSGETSLRIRADYRETLSDLVLEDMSARWADWANGNGFLTKYQAHGCPGNLLDIYAAADIPECESFYASEFDIPGLRREESDALEARPDVIMLKFASSAANISGKNLTSSETLTWLREHFKTALSQCKPEVDQIFLSGVNHVFLHGSTYYPDEALWPGWKFYASVNFVPNNSIWRDAPSMFDYIARCQSILQSGESDNEILVYWPFHDVISGEPEERLLLQLGINSKDEWLVPQPFHMLALELMDAGYSVDFVSDRYLAETRIEDGMIRTPGQAYRVLVVPDCRHMPVETLRKLISLGSLDGKVVFAGLPETVPGFNAYRARERELAGLLDSLKAELTVSGNITATLTDMGMRGEPAGETGLDFIRRKMPDGKSYFLVNHTPRTIDQNLTLETRAASVFIMDPLTGRTGVARTRRKSSGTSVYIQLRPGESLILRTFDSKITGDPWTYYRETGQPATITGPWKVEFVDGGPALPAPAEMEELESWTVLGREAEAFSGTACYTVRFDNPDPSVDEWLLNLGDVRESARVKLNGKDLGCLWSVPFCVRTGELEDGENLLEIEVTNLSANRIRDLERRGIEWKKFYEINMVNRHYAAFDATTWDPMPSGLLGEVNLTPVEAD